MPYSSIAIAAMRISLGDSFSSLFVDAIYGALAMPVATLSFLSISYAFAYLAARAHKR